MPQESPEVAPLVGNAAMRLLGRHVGESAGDSGFSGGLRTEAVCQTKIDDLNRTGAGKHDVRRLDVAMSDLACVCRRKAMRHHGLKGDDQTGMLLIGKSTFRILC